MYQSISELQPLLGQAEQPESSADLRFDLTEAITAEAMADNADRLMASLFDHVDRLLEGNEMPSVKPAAVEPPPAPMPVVPLETILPPKVAPRDLIPQLPTLEEPSEPEPEATEAEARPEVSEKSRWSPLWLAVLISSLLVSAGILSFLFRDQLIRFWALALGRSEAPATVATAPAEPENPKDADFLKYIQRSLDRLAKQPEPSPIVAVSPSPSPNVVERVYVPIYPAAPSPAITNPTTAAAPASPASKPTANRPAVPIPAVGNNPSPAASPVPNIAVASQHTLVGVLELGDRSAALFEVNGTPQRIEIGEPIGTSGWTLVSIKNQEALVRRNGEVRSIYVGQKF